MQVYKLADEEYFKKLKINLEMLTYKNEDECVAKFTLEDIAMRYVNAVEGQFLDYIVKENKNITLEAKEKNLIFTNNEYGFKTLAGIKNTYKISQPTPIINVKDFLLKK